MSESLGIVFEGQPERVELRRLPTPTPNAGEVLVRVLGCTICGSDLHSYSGRRQVAVPTILGHEIVGEIIALGEESAREDIAGQTLRIGDRVTWAIVAHCGECFYCQRDLPQKCLQGIKYGHEAFRPGRELVGGMAEHCLLVRGTSIVRLPECLPLAVACPANCATATVSAAIEAVGQLKDRTIGVIGAGMLGLTSIAMAHVAGAKVVSIEPHEVRRELSVAFGAHHPTSPEDAALVVRNVTNGFGLDAILEMSGASGAWDMALPLLRMGGRLILVGSVFPGQESTFRMEHIVRRNLLILGVHNYTPRHLLGAVNFLSAHHERFPFASMVAEWFDLRDAPSAFELAHDPRIVRVGFMNRGSDSQVLKIAHTDRDLQGFPEG